MKMDQASFRAVSAYCGNDAAQDRVRRFMPMVRRAAWHVYGGGRDGLEIDDLVQSGLIALTECARRHAGPTEDGFAAYAKIRVRGAMIDLVRRNLPDSRGATRRRRMREDTAQRLHLELGRAPTAAELAQNLGTDVAAPDYRDQPIHLASLDEAYDDGDTGFADDAPDAFAMLSAEQDSAGLAAAIARLPERQRLVLQLYFVEELNLSEIAAILEVSIPRVHQIKASALKALRQMLADARPD